MLQILSKTQTYAYVNTHRGKDLGERGNKDYLLGRRQQAGRGPRQGRQKWTQDESENLSTLLVPNLPPVVRDPSRVPFLHHPVLLHLKNSQELKPSTPVVQ